MYGKSALARIGAMMAGGLMLSIASTANATFTDMTYDCTFTGPIGATSCGPTIKPDSVSIPLDGHIGIWETYYMPGTASVQIDLSGTYTGEMPGDRVYYSLGFDKDFVNMTSTTFYGFDMILDGVPGWEPMLMMSLPYVDTAGYFTSTMANPGGVWFDGMLPYGMTAKMWAAVMVPLQFVEGGMVEGQYTGTVHGHLTIWQIAKVPEPGTLALFGLGLVGLGFARRRKASV